MTIVEVPFHLVKRSWRLTLSTIHPITSHLRHRWSQVTLRSAVLLTSSKEPEGFIIIADFTRDEGNCCWMYYHLIRGFLKQPPIRHKKTCWKYYISNIWVTYLFFSGDQRRASGDFLRVCWVHPFGSVAQKLTKISAVLERSSTKTHQLVRLAFVSDEYDEYPLIF